MTIYLVIFFCSLVFACIANKYRSRRILFYIFSVLTLFPTSFLAGIRNPGVGSDTTTYLTPWWSTFCNIKSFDQLLTMYNGHLFDDLELGYVILNYLTSRVSTSEFAIYFVTNALFSISVLFSSINFCIASFQAKPATNANAVNTNATMGSTLKKCLIMTVIIG